MIPYDSPKMLADFLSRRGLALKKRFGQNFLVNPGVRERILRCLAPAAGDLIWEIGPGLGCMTRPLLESGARLRVFEIDRGFMEILREEFGGRDGFTLTGGDVLATWGDHRGEGPDKVFGNLPYASAAAIIAAFLEEGFIPELGVFMVQKEVARRMTAAPGSPDYSSFSLLCRTFCRVRTLFDVAPGSFFPAPGVVSTLVELRPRIPAPVPGWGPGLSPGAGAGEGLGPEPEIPHRRLYLELLRALFSSRRKTVRNNLLRFAGETGRSPDWAARILAEAGLDPGVRAENLDVEDLARLTEAAAGGGPEREG